MHRSIGKQGKIKSRKQIILRKGARTEQKKDSRTFEVRSLIDTVIKNIYAYGCSIGKLNE